MIPIPLNDHIRRRIFWFSTLLLIVANVLVFLFELSLGPKLNRLVLEFGIIPARYAIPQALVHASPAGLVVPIFASMFLHGGWLHLIGNMLFLFVFGRSIEDRFGHLKFLLIYFLSGLVAAATHILVNTGSTVPTIGASGAIAGVLGAYAVCFPRARITTLIPLFIFFWTVQIPALFLLGYWFLIQFVAGYQMLAIENATAGGVGWWGHVGGVIAGVLLGIILRPIRPGPGVFALRGPRGGQFEEGAPRGAPLLCLIRRAAATAPAWWQATQSNSPTRTPPASTPGTGRMRAAIAGPRWDGVAAPADHSGVGIGGGGRVEQIAIHPIDLWADGMQFVPGIDGESRTRLRGWSGDGDVFRAADGRVADGSGGDGDGGREDAATGGRRQRAVFSDRSRKAFRGRPRHADRPRAAGVSRCPRVGPAHLARLPGGQAAGAGAQSQGAAVRRGCAPRPLVGRRVMNDPGHELC